MYVCESVQIEERLFASCVCSSEAGSPFGINVRSRGQSIGTGKKMSARSVYKRV